MKVLFIASRSPWPPTDGGRVLMAHTIDGLLQRGHHVTVVASTDGASSASQSPRGPSSDQLRVILVPHRRPPWLVAAALSAARGVPASVVRQTSAAARAEVARLLDAEPFDVVHVEQLQALPKADAAIDRRLPVILRAENVESDLWRAFGETRPIARLFAAFETRRFARFEARGVRRASATVALTDADAERLRRLAPGARVLVVPAPMPSELPARAAPLEGDPAIAIVASMWHPNQDGVAWFVREIWPSIVAALPAARLHLFGGRRPAAAGVELHEPPADSQDAFARHSILAVPVRVASGVRVRILEAWARGVPVVATRAAVEGLDVADGQGLRVAETANEFVQAIRDLHAFPDRAASLVNEGRAVLRNRHDPADCAARLEAVYEEWRGRRDSNPRPLA